MNFKTLIALELFFVLLCAMSCDEPGSIVKPVKTNCVPANTILGEDSLVYEYNSSGRLMALSYYLRYNRRLFKRENLNYNSEGQLASVIRTTIVSPTVERFEASFEFVYDAQGRPLQMTNSFDEDKSFIPKVTTFTHDNLGRLTLGIQTMEGLSYYSQYRYEWDGNNNVIKVYYKGKGPEELGRENTSFDGYPRFYTNSKEMEFLYVYVFEQEPSASNPITANVYKGDPYSWFGPPTAHLTNSLIYDENAMVESSSSTFSGISDFKFYRMNYSCP